MTAEQISRELRHIEATYVTPPKRLCELADAVDALKQPPIPPTLEQACPECVATRLDLKGHPNSKLSGESGLAQATMRHVAQLEDACRIALWIKGKLEEKKRWGHDLEEWHDIEKALE